MVMLPEPQFIDTDTEKILRELVEQFENLTGRKLYPAQIERLLIDIIAYRESLLRIGIQEAAKQNLLAYARGIMLDHLGQLTGAERLKRKPARTKIKFEIEQQLDFDIVIPAGTEIQTKDDKFIFKTDTDAVIKTGQTYTEVSATCTEATEKANGYLIGDVNKLISYIPYVTRVYNTIITMGGAEEEDDERYRQRIRESIERFSNAGSAGAYRYFAISAHQDIIDATVSSNAPGTVNIYILTKQREEDSNILSIVKNTLNDEKIRPLTDRVIVSYAEKIEYQISANIIKCRNAPDPTQQIIKKLNKFTDDMSSKIGNSVRRSKIISEIQTIHGVESVELLQPTQDIILTQSQFAVCNQIHINIAGESNNAC